MSDGEECFGSDKVCELCLMGYELCLTGVSCV